MGQGGAGSNNGELKIQAGASTGNDIIAFLNQAGSTRGNITYDTDNNFVLFNVNAGEKLRIGSAGQIGLSGANYGTSGQVLTSQGASAAPQWASPAGVWVKLFSGSATSGQTHTMTTNGLTDTYYYYKIIFNMNTSSGNGSEFGIDVTRDGGTTWGSSEFGGNKYNITTSGRWGGSAKDANYNKTYGYLEPSTGYEVYNGVIDFAGVHFTNQYHRFHKSDLYKLIYLFYLYCLLNI